ARVVKRDVARCREVVRPGVMEDAGPVGGGDRDRSVRRASVDDDDLVDDALERRQAARKVAFFVPHDHGGREEWRAHQRPPLPGGGQKGTLRRTQGRWASRPSSTSPRTRRACCSTSSTLRLMPPGWC